jgi:glycosyltransferase involved in cell wall biosynthesis
VNGIIPKLLVLSIFPLWSVWVGWRNRIDFVVAFGSFYAFLLGLSKKILKRPMVTLIRLSSCPSSKTYKSIRGVFLKKVHSLGLIVSDRIITNYNIDHDDIIMKLKNRKGITIDILYNNIPAVKYSSSEEVLQIRKKFGIPFDAKVILTAGIINRRKNIGVLIKCLPEVKINNLYLIIAGDGSATVDFNYKDSLKQLVRELGIDQQVIFTGWLEKEDLWKVYQVSDLFVLPSLNEGMPNAMLEALGLGVPCIGSNIPGVKDILHYEELLFDPLVEQILINKIRQFFSDKYYLSKIIQLCMERKKIFIFDWKEKVYEMVVGYLYPMRDEKIKRS